MSNRFLNEGAKKLTIAGVIAVACLGGVPAAAQTNAEVAPFLRVEWKQTTETWRRPHLIGFVYNDSTYRIGSVRLRVEALDDANQVVSQTLAWAYVSVPARGREAFEVPRPREGQNFRITVESFVLIAREAPTQSP